MHLGMSCVVCCAETKKYKCPKCMEHYCSLNCYKVHKENGCENKASPQESLKNSDNKHVIPFKTEDTVEPAKLDQLRESEGLKNLLYNPHLRRLLQEIDAAPSAWKAMKAAMQEPLFVEFADECLKVVEPMQDDENHSC